MATIDTAFEGGWLRFFNAPVSRERSRDVVAYSLVIGLAFDLAMRSGVMAVSGSLAILLASASLIASGRLRTKASIACVAAAPVFGVWLSLRASDWLIPFDVIASCALVALGASLGSGASFWDLTVPRVMLRGFQAFAQFFLAPRFLVGSARGPRTSTVFAVLRGIGLALPVVIILAALLSSGDAVFASIVDFDIDIADGIEHVLLIGFGTLAAAWLFRLASLTHVAVPHVDAPRIGRTEWLCVVGALNLLLGTFAVARIIAFTEGGRKVITSAGLTWAEYARSGFFQLVGAAVVTALSVLALRAAAHEDRDARLFKGLSLAVVAFTLLIVVTAFQRLVLYERVFGLTMLRVYVQVAIVGIAIFCVMLALVVLGVHSEKAWLWPAAGIVALGLLFALNVFNPEAFVAEYNLEHADESARFDGSYLVSGLGADAAPVLAEHGRLAWAEGCEPSDRIEGWADYNLAIDRADDLLNRVCAKR
jgi:hypothetical protein